LHIGGVFDKSARRPSAPPARKCLGAQTVAAHPRRRIGAGPPGWGTSGRTAGPTRGWMGAHAPITALRPEANGSGGIYRFFSLLLFCSHRGVCGRSCGWSRQATNRFKQPQRSESTARFQPVVVRVRVRRALR